MRRRGGRGPARIEERRSSIQRDDAFRVLASNVTLAMADLERPAVIVTSALEGEGKTSTAVNLSRALARAGQRVILIDLDLRHPDAHRALGVDNGSGVAEVLLDEVPLERCLQFVDVGTGPANTSRGLYLLSTGQPVADPTELLGTRRTARLLGTLAEQADVVVIDTPPVLPVADTLQIGRMAAGAILVVEPRRTPTAAVRRAKEALIRSQTRILGVVINRFQPLDTEAHSYRYGYAYDHSLDG